MKKQTEDIPEPVVFQVRHGAKVTEYTEWAIARQDAINQLQQQWVAAHGPALTETDSKRRTLTCENIVWACTNGDYHGLENVPMTITAFAGDIISTDRLAAAQRSTLEAHARINGVALLPSPSENTPLTHAAAA